MKELVIPVGIDAHKAMQALRTLGDQAQKTGNDMAGGAKKGEEGFASMAVEVVKANFAMDAIGLGKQALDIVAQGAIQASQDVARMAQEFLNLRDRARELAGVLGKPANIEFTKEQAHFAAETGFADPAEAIAFRTSFQGEANQYASRFKSAEDFEKFEKEAARLGNKYGVSPKEMAELAGMTIRTGAMEGQTSEEAMRRLGAAFKTLSAGSGLMNELAGQLSRMSGLVGPDRAFRNIEEAATHTRASAESNLPEAYTWATEERIGVLHLATKKAEEGKRLGITAETSNLEAIKKLSQDQEKSGKNLDLYLRELFPLERVAKAFNESITAYRGKVVQKGLEDAAAVKPGEMEKETAGYFADPTQPGMLHVEKARTKVKEAEMATSKATIAAYMERAHTELLEQEKNPNRALIQAIYESPPMQWARGFKGQGYKGYEQFETERAMGMIQRDAATAGVNVGQAPDILTDSQTKVERWMAQAVQLLQKANEQRHARGNGPISAPPPASGSRETTISASW